MRPWTEGLLRRIARRCDVHDAPSPARTRQLEQELNQPLSDPPESLADAFYNPAIVDCGHTWCHTRRR